MTGSITRVALVGARGHGASYLDRLDRLAETGRARLVAVADPRPPGPLATRLSGATWHDSLADLLADPRARPDVVVLATPVHTHTELAVTALRAGCDVLLEKPPTPSLAQYEELRAAANETGRICQIGFQTFGSEAVEAVRRIVADGELGTVTGFGALGTWVRTAAYWARAAWAGRRRLDGRDVVDGVVTNPLAHAVATALLVAGATRLDQVAAVETDLYRANDIEADDTSSGVVTLADGQRLGFGLTLCAARRSPALVLVHGSAGTLRLAYESDTIEVDGRGGTRTLTFGRTDLLDDLLTARETGRRPRCPVDDTAAFMRVLEAVRQAGTPTPIANHHLHWQGEGDDRHPVVTDVEKWCRHAATRVATFTALGAPWTPRQLTSRLSAAE
ncbi:Gfo/Idh/MocA family protein [Actinophytocola algeriensis]|uniref:Putative dehydrogenase n=1 Tax=Actinophytocola algeriensis TaxID=1768010 RepID=A0A7W7Q320_9PSEU|nr:Gfo/Idh/MocA family oxidoreductase [Actinophytocola algeriensis]MBB4906137.1 putative dehydrogenase [Actinophytocola algeriensis]MBE1472178.1 putative dehydrogenase [Actinophytocola algeriensis]